MSSNCLTLSDTTIFDLLINLTKPEILHFRDQLGQCLIDFSTTDERKYQPQPGVILRPDGQRSLFRAFTSDSGVGVKVIVHKAPDKPTAENSSSSTGKESSNDSKTQKQAPLHGVLVLTDAAGLPTSLMNAEEVTGYRTSLCAMIPYMWRSRTENVVMFGAGKQALWHLRLALGLRGSEIKNITFVNRSRERAEELMKKLEKENGEKGWAKQVEMEVLDSSSQQGYEEELKKRLGVADVVFCTVPSQSVLFPAEWLLKRAEGKESPYVSAIGSWQPDMIELDPALLNRVEKASRGRNPSGGNGGFIVVDDRESTSQHAGEVLKSDLKEEHLVEVGEVLSLQKQDKISPETKRWLEEGLLVYKSCGVSVTDLVAGNAILALAKEKNVGVSVSL